MLLAIDCGNTHLCIGLFQENKLVGSWRISTDTSRTEDEYLVLMDQFLRTAGISMQEIRGMIVGSVVPGVNVALNKLAYKYLKCDCVFVDHSTPCGLKIGVDQPSGLGADRIINAVAAHEKYAGDLIVIDFGTAATFDCVSADGVFLGGAICPGFDISQKALYSHAAKLANVNLKRPPAVIGKNTEDSLCSGLLWGYGGQIDALTRRMKEELSGKVTVIATGGWATFLRNFSESIDVVDSQLTLEGLSLIWHRCHTAV